MDLKEFTKNVLIDLDTAISEARSETSRDITFTGSKENRTVEFDIAVAVESSTEKSGSAGIKVLEFVKGDGKMSLESKNSTVSRVKFGVNFETLTKEEGSTRKELIAKRLSNRKIQSNK
jgi:hypothetical protein